MSSFLGQAMTVSAKPVAAKRVDTTVRAAAAKKAAPKRSAGPAKNKWLAAEGGFDESKWYGPDRKLYLPGGLLDPSEVPDYLDGTLPGE